MPLQCEAFHLSNFRALKNLLLIGCLLIAPHLGALAEKADRQKPMNVEADNLGHDELKQTSVFTGKVLATKGTITMRGDRIEVRQDPDGYQYGVIKPLPGQLAFFRQKREGVDEFIEGMGDTLVYNSKADTVRFEKNAVLRRYRGATLADEVTGAIIVYENLTDKFNVDGSAPGAATKGRVRAMLTPKPEGKNP